jgi:pimeloyl-ACP methyl ester carboxylesterase
MFSDMEKWAKNETCLVRDIPVHYVEYGEGKPVLLIHGWSTDHRMMSGGFEPIFEQTQGYRRIYIDLPGMGQTPAAQCIQNSDDVLDILCEFIDKVIGNENFLLAGCSYGGYLSLGLIHKKSDKIDGVLFLVAMVDSYGDSENPDQKPLLWQSELMESLDKSPSLTGYMNMAVIATPEMYNKWITDIQPGVDAHDKEFLGSQLDIDFNHGLAETIRNVTFDKPSSILVGRQENNSACCHAKAYTLVDRFPRATFAVLDCAGHLLNMDNEPLFRHLVKDWLWRVELEKSI